MGLARLNTVTRSRKHWRDLTVEEFKAVLAYAKEPEGERSQSREEWMRFTMEDENGQIPANGLARALEQRKALVHEPAGRHGANGFLQPTTTSMPSNLGGWTNLTGYIHPVGRINALLIHPTSTSTMWAGTDGGGIWKTTNGGSTWQPVNDFLGSLSVSSFAMQPGDPSTIYAATGAQGSHTGVGGAGVFRSTDGGITWIQLTSTIPSSPPSDWNYVFQLAIHPADSNTIMAATSGGAYQSVNAGATWTKLTATTLAARNVAIHPSNANLRVIAMDDGTVRIATDGMTYNSYTIATVSGSSYTRIALAPSNQSIMYALLNNGGTTQLYRSTTGGTTWASVTPPANFFYNYSYLSYTGGLWVDPTNANHIAVVEGWAAVTSDASLPTPTWQQADAGWTDFHGVVGDPGYNGSTDKIVYFFDDGGLYRWSDVDTIATVYPSFLSPNGIVNTEAYSAAGWGGNVVFGAQDVGARFYTTSMGDPTQKWRFVSLPYSFTQLNGDGAATAADHTNSNILYGSLQFLTIERSLDGGSTGQLICQGITDINCNPTSMPPSIEGGNAAFIAPYVLDPNNQSRMLAGAASLWRSNNVSSGAPPTWTQIQTGVPSVIVAIAIAPSNSDVIWVAYSNGSVYNTSNGTATTPTWTPVTTVPAGNKLRIFIDPMNSSHVYVGLSGFSANRLVVTPDGGTTWSPVSGLPSASVFAIQQHPANSSWLYVGTAVGLFVSADGGTTWSTTNEGSANAQVRDLSWYAQNGTDATLTVATFGRGIWQVTANACGTLPAPAGLAATIAPGPVPSLTWSAVTGATGYKIYRSSSLFVFMQIGTSTAASFNDSGAAPGTSYLYIVRATNGTTDSCNSSNALVTNMLFTDPTLTVGATTVKALHFIELRGAINAVRTLAALGSATYTDASLSAGGTVRGVDVTELRSALDPARSVLGIAALTYTDSTITPGSTVIKAVHLNELRRGVQAPP